MALLILYLMIALVFSFFCSIAEAALLSVRPAYIAALEQRQARSAATLRRLKDNLDRPLAAILSLNTIAHTVGAVGVGAQAAAVFGNQYVGLASAIMTLLVLVLSEIIPKTLGATHWPRLAPVLAPAVVGLTRLLMPLVWMSEHITRLLTPRGDTGAGFSREELQAMAQIGAEEGQIDTKELKIVSNLMRLQAISVRDIMTPRPVIFMAPARMTVAEFFARHAARPFSRIPIYGENRDDVVGYVLKADLLMAQANDDFDQPLETMTRSFLALPDRLTASDVFDRLLHERAHFALVLDEYGTLQGLVTLEDVIETLIGLEITDELDTVENMRALAHKRWRERVKTLGIDPDSPEQTEP